jgi:hypothetical protein
MEPRYSTLKTIYEIVKGESNPISYACFPNQIIIHQSQPWDNILKQLYVLAEEELITIQQPGTTICITNKGIDKVLSAAPITTSRDYR